MSWLPHPDSHASGRPETQARSRPRATSACVPAGSIARTHSAAGCADHPGLSVREAGSPGYARPLLRAVLRDDEEHRRPARRPPPVRRPARARTLRISRRSGSDQNRRRWPDPPVIEEVGAGAERENAGGPCRLDAAGRGAVRRSPGKSRIGRWLTPVRREPATVGAHGDAGDPGRILRQPELLRGPVQRQDAGHGPAPQDLERERPRLGRVEEIEARPRVGQGGGRDRPRGASVPGRGASRPRRAGPRPSPARARPRCASTGPP